jgi:hypothetical protein
MAAFNAGIRLDLLKFETGAQKSIPNARLFVLTTHKLSESLKQMYYSSSLPLNAIFHFIKNDYKQIVARMQGTLAKILQIIIIKGSQHANEVKQSYNQKRVSIECNQF